MKHTHNYVILLALISIGIFTYLNLNRNEFGKKTSTGNNIIRLQTLYHADKQKMDRYILDLAIYLHRLINLVKNQDKIPKYSPA